VFSGPFSESASISDVRELFVCGYTRFPADNPDFRHHLTASPATMWMMPYYFENHICDFLCYSSERFGIQNKFDPLFLDCGAFFFAGRQKTGLGT
jgi:hypothetical protein